MAAGDRVGGSGRVEAFSDGVFAIAITLLVLDLKAPERPDAFGQELLDQWPSYVAYVAAFAVLGLIWLSHHDLFSRIQGVSTSLLLRNLFLLFLVALFSFPTAVLAASFRVHAARDDQLLAIGVFTLTAIAITLAWVRLTRSLLHAPQLASDQTAMTRYVHVQSVFAGVACAVLGLAFLVGFVSPLASVVLIALLPLINLRFYRGARGIPASEEAEVPVA